MHASETIHDPLYPFTTDIIAYEVVPKLYLQDASNLMSVCRDFQMRISWNNIGIIYVEDNDACLRGLLHSAHHNEKLFEQLMNKHNDEMQQTRIRELQLMGYVFNKDKPLSHYVDAYQGTCINNPFAQWTNAYIKSLQDWEMFNQLTIFASCKNINFNQEHHHHLPLCNALLNIKDTSKIKPIIEFLLINNRLEINKRDSSGWTLLKAAASRYNIELAELLLEYGAHLQYALHAALKNSLSISNANQLNNCIKMATLLLNKGADVNEINEYGVTPLHMVISRCKNNEKLVRLLLSRGANKNIKNYDKWSPLQIAQHWRHQNIIALFNETTTRKRSLSC